MSTSLVLILLISAGGNLEISISLETILSISSGDNLEISIDEIRLLTRWLNRKEFHKFKILNEEYFDIYFEGSFNISKIEIDGKVYGLELELKTKRPFALMEPQKCVIKNLSAFTVISDATEDKAHCVTSSPRG